MWEKEDSDVRVEFEMSEITENEAMFFLLPKEHGEHRKEVSLHVVTYFLCAIFLFTSCYNA